MTPTPATPPYRDGRKVPPSNLMGVAELADLFYGHAGSDRRYAFKTSITSWAANPNANFPQPVAQLAATPVWDVADVINWWLDYVPLKGTKRGRLSADVVRRFTGRILDEEEIRGEETGK